MLTKSKKYIMHRGVLSLIFAFALSVSAILSPLVRAEESPKYTWKDIAGIPGGDIYSPRISPDGLRLFANQYDAGDKLLTSVDNGATWSVYSPPVSTSAMAMDRSGTKLVVSWFNQDFLYLSTNSGSSWTKTPSFAGIVNALPRISPDGSILTACNQYLQVKVLYVSMDNGATWLQKGSECPDYVLNDGKMIRINNDNSIRRSSDYGLTWSTINTDRSRRAVFSYDGQSAFDGENVSLDGGVNWNPTPEVPPRSSNNNIYAKGISNDGKRMFVTFIPASPSDSKSPMMVSSDGGKTWQKWGDEGFMGIADMSADGSRIFALSGDPPDVITRLATLPTPPPVTPGGTGSGAGGTTTPSTPATPSTGSSSSGASIAATTTSSTSSKKPEKLSSKNLAETGNSIWLVSGLAVIAVVAGGLALRKRP